MRFSAGQLKFSRFFGVRVVTDRCGLEVTSRRGPGGQEVNGRGEIQLRQGKPRPRMFHVKPPEAATGHLLASLREGFGVFDGSVVP